MPWLANGPVWWIKLPPGNPVVFANCDQGAPKTLAIYWMYDNMPVTQPDNWIAPPFEARIVDGQTATIRIPRLEMWAIVELGE